MNTNTQSLVSAFRASRNQILSSGDFTPPCKSPDKKPRKPKSGDKEESTYDQFLKKYRNIDKCLEDFTPLDLVYYFRETARDIGNNYIISNFSRDISLMKKTLKHLSVEQVCLVIEFLFQSEQNYLDKKRVAPTILVSNWINTLTQDSQLWLEDNYEPSTKPKSNKVEREWQDTEQSSKCAIGKWD